MAWSKEVGSDVPFFINGGAAFVKGRGDLVEMKDISAEHHLVLVKPPFGVSAGWAYSNQIQAAVPLKGYGDGQYTAIPGSGQGGSDNYGISFIGYIDPPTVILDSAGVVDGFSVTNNNYAYYSMLEGDAIAKKFGGISGDDEDWFLLTITGKDVGGAVTGTVDFYLADFRFADNQSDYIVDDWEFVDLASLGVVKSLEFALSSSDVGGYGMNTPAYFAADTFVPEPGTILLLGAGCLTLFRRRKL